MQYFYWPRNINFFLHSYGYNLDKFDVHLTKAWATFTAKDQYISSHKHTASHYSCVYYVRNNDMGKKEREGGRETERQREREREKEKAREREKERQKRGR